MSLFYGQGTEKHWKTVTRDVQKSPIIPFTLEPTTSAGVCHKANVTLSIIHKHSHFLCPALQLSGLHSSSCILTMFFLRGSPMRVVGTIPQPVLSQSIPAQPSLPLPSIVRLVWSGPPGGSHSDPHYMNRETSFDWEMKADSKSDSSCTHLHKLSHPIPLQMQKCNYRALCFHLEKIAAALYPCSLFWGWAWQRDFCCCSALLRASAVHSWLTAPHPAAQAKQAISLLQSMLPWWRTVILSLWVYGWSILETIPHVPEVPVWKCCYPTATTTMLLLLY